MQSHASDLPPVGNKLVQSHQEDHHQEDCHQEVQEDQEDHHQEDEHQVQKDEQCKPGKFAYLPISLKSNQYQGIFHNTNTKCYIISPWEDVKYL